MRRPQSHSSHRIAAACSATNNQKSVSCQCSRSCLVTLRSLDVSQIPDVGLQSSGGFWRVVLTALKKTKILPKITSFSVKFSCLLVHPILHSSCQCSYFASAQLHKDAGATTIELMNKNAARAISKSYPGTVQEILLPLCGPQPVLNQIRKIFCIVCRFHDCNRSNHADSARLVWKACQLWNFDSNKDNAVAEVYYTLGEESGEAKRYLFTFDEYPTEQCFKKLHKLFTCWSKSYTAKWCCGMLWHLLRVLIARGGQGSVIHSKRVGGGVNDPQWPKHGQGLNCGLPPAHKKDHLSISRNKHFDSYYTKHYNLEL